MIDCPSWDHFEREVRALYESRNKQTWYGHRRVLGLLKEEFDHPASVSIDGIVRIRERLLAKGLETVSVNSTLRIMRVQCGLLYDMSLISFHPFKTRSSLLLRERRIDREKKKRHLSIEEVSAVFRQADKEFAAATGIRGRFTAGRLRALIYLLAYTGVRAGEALHMRRQDVQWERRIISINDDVHRLKTAASCAEVGIAERGLSVLFEWSAFLQDMGYSYLFPLLERDSPWVDGTQAFRPAGMMRDLGDRAGVRDVTPKAWRHTVGTHLRQRFRASAEQVQTHLRHSNVRTQEHYDHRDEENLRRIADLIQYPS